MKLICPNDSTHQKFHRESYDSQGSRVNIEVVDEYGRLIGDPLDLYSGDVTYTYFCAECEAAASEINGVT